MTKKDYQAMARAIYYARLRVVADYPTDRAGMRTEDYLQGVKRSMEALVGVLEHDNPRFDRARFIEACETGTTKGMRKVG